MRLQMGSAARLVLATVAVAAMMLPAGSARAQADDQHGIVLDNRAAPGAGRAQKPAPADAIVVLETSMGTMTFRLLEADAPATTANFKRLLADGFYDGKPFYRVAAGHVIQAGDGGDNDQPRVQGEFGAHDHVEGALGLARDADPDSGSTEIYVCLADRPHLDGSYAVFGLLVDGLEVLRAIGAVPVNERWAGRAAMHEPVEPVLIKRAYVKKEG